MSYFVIRWPTVTKVAQKAPYKIFVLMAYFNQYSMLIDRNTKPVKLAGCIKRGCIKRNPLHNVL